MNQKAYTIVELLVVIAILLILATIALNSAGGIIKEQKMNNAINELRDELQEARQRALTSRGSQTLDYVLMFKFDSNGNTVSKYYEAAPLPATTEVNLRPPKNYQPAGLNVIITPHTSAGHSPTPCFSTAVIRFIAQSGKIMFACDSPTADNSAIKQFTIELQSTDGTRRRLLNIHRASGTPQIAAP